MAAFNIKLITQKQNFASSENEEESRFISVFKTPRLRRNVILTIATWQEYINFTFLRVKLKNETFFRALIATLYHAYVLLNIGLQYDIFTTTSIVGGFEFPAGILNVVCIHHLGRRATTWGASVGTALCTFICAVLAGMISDH